jgi:hypothetical protein
MNDDNENKVTKPNSYRGKGTSVFLLQDSPVRPVEEVLAHSGGPSPEVQQARQRILDISRDKTLLPDRARQRLAAERFLLKLAAYK